MKIKLAILEKDLNYLNKIVTVFNQKYSDKIQVYSFTDMAVAMNVFNNTTVDVFIAGEMFQINQDKLPSRCAFAYFVDSPDIDMLGDVKCICKFQKVELIYKQILSIYAEKAENITGYSINEESSQIIAFFSPSGGSGASTVAVSCALHFVSQGKRVLYLNLEKFGFTDIFFSAEGQFDMSDIIFALKSRKMNLAMKLESCVKRDSSGVYFYSSPKQSFDMVELNYDDIFRLISELQITGSYDYIIVDVDFDMSNDFIKLLNKFSRIVITCTGSEISNSKIFRFYDAMLLTERNNDISILNKTCLIYNKFSNRTNKVLDNIDIKNIGGIQKFEHATDNQIIQQISGMPLFDSLM